MSSGLRRMPLALEIIIRHENKNEAGAVALVAEDREGSFEPPILCQLFLDGDQKPVQERTGAAYFYVRVPGRYKLVGVWKDGSTQETKPIDVLPAMFTANGYDGLSPEMRKRMEETNRRLERERQARAIAAAQPPPPPPATAGTDPKSIIIGVLVVAVLVLLGIVILR